MSVFGFDAYSPAEIACRVSEVGVAKARLPFAAAAMLGVLAGAFIALAANALGALGIAVLVVFSGYPQMNGGAVAATAVKIAAVKTALPFWQAFFAGILCNVLVCMAVWLAMAGHSVVDKVVAVVLPISAFVAAGFEHSVANMYFIPLGILLRDTADLPAVAGADHLTWAGYVRNLVPVTLGNIVGGSGLVALVYHVIYRRGPARKAQEVSVKRHQNSR